MVKYLYLFLFLILLPLVSAQQQELGVFKEGTCVSLIQTCSNCTYVNVTSVLHPDKKTITVVDSLMTKTGSFYNSTFCNTTQLGEYIVSGIGNPDAIPEVWSYTFIVTVNGKSFDTPQAIAYIFFFLVIGSLFLLTAYGTIMIPGKNQRNPDGEVISINWMKYPKMFCGVLSYGFLTALTMLSWQLSYAYLNLNVIGNFFRGLFTILVGLALPIFVTMVILFMVSYLSDKKVNKFINKFGAGMQ